MTSKSLIQSCVADARLRRALGLTVIFVMSLRTSRQERHPPQTGSVQLRGSETLRPLLTTSAEGLMTRRPQVDVIVQGGGSGTGIVALLQGLNI